MKPALHIQGMHGMGDCLHQRAVLRQLMQTKMITLETSWPSIYHDLIPDGLAVCRRPSGLRTQAKNAAREADKFVSRHFTTRPALRISYTGQQVLHTASKTILETMCNVTGTNYAEADYRLPVSPSWTDALRAQMGTLPEIARERPWLVYRPLVARPEWRGSMARNADPACYHELFNLIRDKFFVISVADLEEGREWIVGSETKADLSFHKGELVFETLAALFKQSALVFTSSGFAAVLGPAVETPTISIVGGYEDPRCHDAGKKFAPYLAIGPSAPCHCWSSACTCRFTDRKLNMLDAIPQVEQFVARNCIR